jgi:hypothetical protein
MFATLLDPVPVDTFFSQYWEREPLAVVRTDPRRYENLLSLDDIDRLLASTVPQYPDIRLARGEETVSADEFTLPDGRIDPIAISKLFADGSSIVASSMHQRISTLTVLCQRLEQELSIPFQANVYLTPARSQGFKVHYDTHDVFILQISGSKDWRIYGAPLPLPFRGQPHEATGVEPGSLTHEFRLSAGDCAYVPRGFFHEAIANDDVSLHVTLGALCYTWADFMIEAVSAACIRDGRFHRALPIGFANSQFEIQQVTDAMSPLVASLAAIDAGAVLGALVSDFMRNRVPYSRGQLAEVLSSDQIGLATHVSARPGLMYTIFVADDRAVVSHFNAEISFPLIARDALHAALSGESVRVGSLSDALTEETRVTIARKLVREGLLHVVPDGD